MKKSITILILFAFLGCKEDFAEKRFSQKEVIVIDGCEYFKYRTAYKYIHITHKGNCNNPIHNVNEQTK